MSKRVKVCLIVCLLCLIGCHSKGQLFSVDNSKVSESEYTYFLNTKMYSVIDYFQKKYHAQYHAQFWQSDAYAEKPLDKLMDDTLLDLKKVHAVYKLAKESGIIDDASYDGIVKRWQKENEIRAERIKNNQPVYGLSSFTFELFLEYEMDQIEKTYIANDKHAHMQLTQEELEAYYEKEKSTLFVKPDDVKLAVVKIDSSQLDAQAVEKIKKDLEMVALQNDSDFKAMIEKHGLGQYYQEVSILSAESGVYAKHYPDIAEYAFGLAAGQISPVIDNQAFIYLIKCVDRMQYSYYTLSEVKDNVEKNLRELKYADYISELADKIQLDYNRQNLQTFTREYLNNKK